MVPFCRVIAWGRLEGVLGHASRSCSTAAPSELSHVEHYFYAEARVAVANGLKFIAINNIPLGENRCSRFNMLSKRPNSSRTWAGMRNYPLTSWRGAVAARRPRRTSSCSPMRRRNVPRSISRSLARLRGINAVAFQGLSYRRPLAPHRHYHRSQVEGTFPRAQVCCGAADPGTLRAPRWRPRERPTSIGREKLFGPNSAQART
jgi:hypothetical protein